MSDSELSDVEAANLIEEVQHAADPALSEEEHEKLGRVQQHLRSNGDS